MFCYSQMLVSLELCIIAYCRLKDTFQVFWVCYNQSEISLVLGTTWGGNQNNASQALCIDYCDSLKKVSRVLCIVVCD